MAHHKKGKRTDGKRLKRKGYIAKGITKRHRWDRRDHGNETGSRGLLKKEVSQQLIELLEKMVVE